MKHDVRFLLEHREVFRNRGWVYAAIWTMVMFTLAVFAAVYPQPPVLFQSGVEGDILSASSFLPFNLMGKFLKFLDEINNFYVKTCVILLISMCWWLNLYDHYKTKVEMLADKAEQSSSDCMNSEQRWILSGYDTAGQALNRQTHDSNWGVK